MASQLNQPKNKLILPLKYHLLVLGLCTNFLVWSQTETKSFTVKFTTEQIIADGELNEIAWETAESARDYWEYFPLDTIPARSQSDIKMLYDDKNLYIGIKAMSLGKKYALQSLKRDFRGSGSDSFSLVFDTFNDGTNAFMFGINPYGVRREALISNGGGDRRDYNLSWDVKWQGNSKMHDGYYTSEMIIPLTSLKFKKGARSWRFNSYRIDTQSNERSTWIRIPQNQLIYNLAFMGEMVFERPLGTSRTPLAIIPFVNAISQKNFETNDKLNNIKFGGDAKVSIGNSLNLDITVNPDFSQVEVDDQVTNLTRFEVQLPEKRQFFIDNNDLFASFGDGRDASPFFSRRIGIAQDTSGNTIENSIIGGLRLSGKLTKDLRIGALNIQTAADEENEIASNNNTMLAFQQRVFSRSNIGMFFINRQAFKDYDFLAPDEKFNRVLGIDYNLASLNNTWNGKFFVHKSFQPDDSDGNMASGFNIRYNSRNYSFYTKAVYVDEEYSSDLGFVRRKDIFKGVWGLERMFWPKKGIVQNHTLSVFPVFIWSPNDNYRNTDYSFRSRWEIAFRNQAMATVGMNNRYTYLQNSFDPTGTDGAIELPGNLGYHYNNVELQYQSDMRKIFSHRTETTIGRFFNGKRFSWQTGLTMRFQPKAFLSVLINYDQIDLPSPYPSANIWLISPKVDITFSKSIFWSTLIQYSNQRDNLGINSRLQWRFAPLSDLFIVYNDNYFVNSFEPKNRSINLKLTYWLNI